MSRQIRISAISKKFFKWHIFFDNSIEKLVKGGIKEAFQTSNNLIKEFPLIQKKDCFMIVSYLHLSIKQVITKGYHPNTKNDTFLTRTSL